MCDCPTCLLYFPCQLLPGVLVGDEVEVGRQAYAGLCWGKQFYSYDGQHHSSPHRRRHQLSTSFSSHSVKISQLIYRFSADIPDGVSNGHQMVTRWRHCSYKNN